VCTTTVRAFDDAVDRLTLDAVDMEILSSARRRRSGVRVAQPTVGDSLCRTIAARESAAFSIGYRVIDPRAGLFFVEPTADYPAAIRHAWTQSRIRTRAIGFRVGLSGGKQTTSETMCSSRNVCARQRCLVERFDDGDSTTFRYRQEFRTVRIS